MVDRPTSERNKHDHTRLLFQRVPVVGCISGSTCIQAFLTCCDWMGASAPDSIASRQKGRDIHRLLGNAYGVGGFYGGDVETIGVMEPDRGAGPLLGSEL